MTEIFTRRTVREDRAHRNARSIKDHEKGISEFEKASRKVDDSDVKAFAARTLPTLREHLQQAKSLRSAIGTSSDTIK